MGRRHGHPLQLRDSEMAAEIYDLLLPHRSEIVVVTAGWVGLIAHILGRPAAAQARDEDAVAHFEEAEELQDRIGALTGLVNTRLELSQIQIRRRQIALARDLLNQALAGSRELGLINLERRAVALLEELSG